MHTLQDKAQILWWFLETKSIVHVQRNCRRIYQKDPPSKSSILWWKKNFLETGSIADKKRSGRPCTSDFDVERVRETLLHTGAVPASYFEGGHESKNEKQGQNLLQVSVFIM